MRLLQDVYESSEITDFTKLMYALWQKLPQSICHTEPFLTLSYADDPLLAYGDEGQTRQLYENMLAYYG